MKNSTLKIALFVCITCMLLVGASIFFSVTYANKYSNQIVVFDSTGEKLSESSGTYKYMPSQSTIVDNSAQKQNDALAVFTYQNIDFVSYSEHWDEEKLEQLAQELFLNVHGDEIAYVARVELQSDNYDEYAGLHRSSYEKYSLPIGINRMLPSDMTLDFSALSSVIVLTGADQNTTVASMARTLSHEYGHHFTQHYFGFRGTMADMASKYASLRKETGAPIYSVVTDWDYYLDNHMWDLQEIAAEDYVFLMGSPLARQRIDYLDNSELADLYSRSEKKYNEYAALSTTAINAYPHENPILQPPSQVDELAEYYYSFVGESAPEYTRATGYGDLSMNLVQTSSGSYTMTWVLPLPYSNVSYTLVAYDSYDYMIKPIKTISGDEQPTADMGIQKVIRSYNEYTIDDGLDDLGFVRFRIVITFFDGSVYFSDPYDVKF